MDYVEGRSVIPLSTYFIGDYGVGAAKVLLASSRDSGNQGFKMDGLKICANLHWLKGSGKFTLQGMIRISRTRMNQGFINLFIYHFQLIHCAFRIKDLEI